MFIYYTFFKCLSVILFSVTIIVYCLQLDSHFLFSTIPLENMKGFYIVPFYCFFESGTEPSVSISRGVNSLLYPETACL